MKMNESYSDPVEVVDRSETNQTLSRSISLGVYQVGVPIMVFFCVLTFIVNLVIVASVAWMRKPLTPTMYFSVSLAGADAFASLVLGTGLVINSLLPVVYNIDLTTFNTCHVLAVEALRLGGIIVTVEHLLALAINHYIGIIRPLHYAAMVTKRSVTICVVTLWIAPIASLFIYFSSVDGQGFQAERCESFDFMQSLNFRVTYATFFFIPLVIMTFIYCHIFVIVRRHQATRRQLTQRVTVSHGFRHSKTPSSHSQSFRYQPCSETCRQTNRHADSQTSIRLLRNSSRTTTCSTTDSEQMSTMQKNVKAIITTLLIVGTFVVGWIPAVVWFIIFCNDCVVKQGHLEPQVIVAISITVNSLIILKSFLDPIIYSARMKDFQVAFQRMRRGLLRKLCPCCKWDWANEEENMLMHITRSMLINSHSVHSGVQRSLRCNSSMQTNTSSILMRPERASAADITIHALADDRNHHQDNHQITEDHQL